MLVVSEGGRNAGRPAGIRIAIGALVLLVGLPVLTLIPLSVQIGGWVLVSAWSHYPGTPFGLCRFEDASWEYVQPVRVPWGRAYQQGKIQGWRLTVGDYFYTVSWSRGRLAR
jgi:hypothetical protein